MPARLSTDASKPGAFMTCNGFEQYDDKTAAYIQATSRLSWKLTDINSMNSFPGIIDLIGPEYSFYFGRFNVTEGGTTWTVVSKVHHTKGFAGICWFDPRKSSEHCFVTTDFEVLTCNF